VTAYRGRKQPVGYRTQILPVFRPEGNASGLKATIAVTHDGRTENFENLFLAQIQVINRGNKDLSEIEFGITLDSEDKCIFIEVATPDRHHEVVQVKAVIPSKPECEMDFVLRPFNRRDQYSLKLYIVVPSTQTKPHEPRLGSPSPVTFVKMPTLGEVIVQAAEESFLLSFWPLKIGFRL